MAITKEVALQNLLRDLQGRKHLHKIKHDYGPVYTALDGQEANLLVLADDGDDPIILETLKNKARHKGVPLVTYPTKATLGSFYGGKPELVAFVVVNHPGGKLFAELLQYVEQ